MKWATRMWVYDVGDYKWFALLLQYGVPVASIYKLSKVKYVYLSFNVTLKFTHA